MKKLIGTFICIVILLTEYVSAGYEDRLFSFGPWIYEILEDGTAEIYMYKGEESQIEVPAELDGIRVTAIGMNAFDPDQGVIVDPDPRWYKEFIAYQDSPRGVESIILPEGITTLRNGAFMNCTGLKTIVIPNSLTELGSNLFDRCFVLTSIQVSPDHPFLEVRDGVLFNRKEARLLYFPMGLATDSYCIPVGTCSIGDYAFSGAPFSSVEIPDTVNAVGNYAFKNTALESIRFPDALTNIGESVLERCSCLVSCDLPGSLISVPDSMFFMCKKLASITIPDGVTSIGKYAFCDCVSLSEIELPESVRTIEKSAFVRCTGLTSFRIPDGVTAIQDSTFFDCSNLTDIIIPDTVNSIESEAFRGCRALTEFIIPDTVSSLGDLAFFECDRLVSVWIPASVQTVGCNPFEGCLSLISIQVPDNHPILKVIDGVLFNELDRRLIAYPCGFEVETYEIPKGTQIIGERAFDGCRCLTSVTIPSSVTSIEDLAFFHCKHLTLSVFRDSYAAGYCEKNHLQYIVTEPN